MAMIAEPTPPPDGVGDADGIRLRDLTVTFRGLHRPALDTVELTVPRGSFFSVVGPSGCGKSTLLRALAGLVPANAGTVSIFGQPPKMAARAKQVGWVPQSPALLPWRTVLDNVRLPLQVNRSPARPSLDPLTVLDRLGLSDALDRLPRELSGGMRQRIAVARAFVFAPALLLMDEPFAALDELTRLAVGHQLLDLWQRDRRTVVFVTHSVTEAVTLSDAVGVMRAGRIVATVPVALPRPRPEGIEEHVEHMKLTAQIRTLLRQET